MSQSMDRKTYIEMKLVITDDLIYDNFISRRVGTRNSK